MTTKLITIAYADQTFPVGTVVSVVTVTVTAPDGTNTPITLTANADGSFPVSTTFEATKSGDYIVTVQALDGAGAALGAAVSGAFSVAAPATVTIPVPSTVTIGDVTVAG